jgi:hypothetical protein
MTINLLAPTETQAPVLIADPVTTAFGAAGSTAGLTKVGGRPVSVCLELQSTEGAFLLPRMTEDQRDALNATPGMQIYNLDAGVINTFDSTNNWVVPTGTGTVTSVDVQNSGSGISFTGGPITGSGTITGTLDTVLQSLSDLVEEGFVVKQGSTLFTRALESADSSQITISNSDGVSGNPIIGMATTGITAGSYTQADITVGEDGRIYAVASGGGSGGAPSNGLYIIQSPNAFLPDAIALSDLSTGLLKNTTGTGVLSVATPGTDYYSLNNPTRILDSGFAVGNFFIGSGAGNLTLTAAEFNTGVGINALNAIDTGIQNTFGGHSAGLSLESGRYNTGWGELCLASLVSLDSCTALGFNAANALVTGGGVVALGANAISATTISTNSFALGRDTVMADSLTNAGVIGYGATISASNAINIGNGCKIGFGVASPAYNLDIAAISNIAAIKVEDTSGTPATPASGSVFYSVLGVPYSLSSSGTPAQYLIDGNPIYVKIGTTSGNQNSMYLGQFVNPNVGTITVARSIALGNNALLNATTGANDIVAIGYRAALSVMTNTNIVAVGSSCMVSVQSSNVVGIGKGVGVNGMSTAATSVVIGTNAGTFLSCSNSVLIGDTVASTIRNSVDSVVVGNLAGPTVSSGTAITFSQNVAIGALSAASTAIGSSMSALTLVGYNTNTDSISTISNAGAFGANASIQVNNAINLGSNCKVGINNPTPAYTFDVATVGGIASMKVADSISTPATPSSGSVFYSVLGVPYSLSISGTPAQYYIDGNPIYIKIAEHSPPGNENSIFMGQYVNPNTDIATISRSIAIGNNAMGNAGNGAADTIAIGYRASFLNSVGTDILAIGTNAAADQVNGSSIIALGTGALAGIVTVNNSIGIGTNATSSGACTYSIIISDTPAAIATCTDSVIIGANAGMSGNSTGAVALGRYAGTSGISTTTTNTTMIGFNANSGSAANLTNAGAFGANTVISVSNAINLGSGCLIGINNSSPIYNLDIAAVSNVCAIKLEPATVVPTTPSSGSITYTYYATTSGTANLALTLLTLPTNKSATIEVLVRGFDSTFANFTGGRALAAVMRGAGNISVVGTQNYVKFATSTGDFSISVDTGTQAAVLNATGVAGVTYTWVIDVKYVVA